MKIYWLNGGLRFEPESTEESLALEIIRESLLRRNLNPEKIVGYIKITGSSTTSGSGVTVS